MDKECVVEELRKCITEMKKDLFDVNFAALLNDINSDTYTLIIASRFLDLLSPRDGIKSVVEYLYSNLPGFCIQFISRVNVINTMDKSILDIGRIHGAIYATDSIIYIKDCNIFGVQIDNMILFECH